MVCVLEQGWNKTLQGCGPPGIEFDTPDLDDATAPIVCQKAHHTNLLVERRHTGGGGDTPLTM